ncbi:MAG: chromate transporter [Eubacteriaceae bacterium]|nr:chromate transporter [Eubacteriaceae bacterium]
MIYLNLCIEFFKTGLFAIGGGLATIPFLAEIGRSTGWFTQADLADMIAVSESTPGPMGVNMATYVGFTSAGVPGAILATLSLVAPSIIVILIVYQFLSAFKDNKTVQAAFYGIRPASVGLIASAGLGVMMLAMFTSEFNGDLTAFLGSANVKVIVLAAILFVITNFVPKAKDLHPIVFIGISAVIGIVFHFAG